MLLTIALVLAAWILLSIVSGVAVGASLKRLDASPRHSPRRPEGWMVVSRTRNSGAQGLLLARTVPSSSHRR